MNSVDCLIEISKDSNIKYEFDKDVNKLRCDRFLHTSMAYPANYGYIPNTLSDDGDPIDILVICDYKLIPNCLLKTKIIGVLEMKDEKGFDEKLISVPIEKIDPNSKYINDLNDLPKSLLDKIYHFFKHYKDTEENKFSKVIGFRPKNIALNYLQKSIHNYNNKNQNMIYCDNVYVKKSTVGDFLGAFALKSFKKNELIERGVMRRLENFDGMNNPHVFTWSDDIPNKTWAMGSGCSTFYNTGRETANCKMLRYYDTDTFEIVANRDINKDEELFHQYKSLDWRKCFNDIKQIVK